MIRQFDIQRICKQFYRTNYLAHGEAENMAAPIHRTPSDFRLLANQSETESERRSLICKFVRRKDPRGRKNRCRNRAAVYTVSSATL